MGVPREVVVTRRGESAFEQASALERSAPGTHRGRIPDGWQQGRGAFGGLVLGTLARAMQAEESDPARRLRTFAGDICGPVLPGEIEIHTRVLRRGANQTNLQAEIRQGGEVLATATGVCSAPRSVPAPRLRPSPPKPAESRELEPLPMEPPFAPVFAQHYAYRTAGPFPFSGGADAVTEGFIVEMQPPASLDAAAIVARLDAWWPAFFSIEEGPRVAATISFLAELLVDPATLAADTPLAHRARVAAAEDGFLVEFRELWSGDRLVAMNQQTFVVIR